MTQSALDPCVPNENPTTASHTRRVTVRLDKRRKITFIGEDLSLDSLMESGQLFLTLAREARKKNLRLTTFLQMLDDMAGRE